MLGDFLYALTVKDQITQPVLQRRLDTTRAQLANAIVVVDGPEVPLDRWARLSHISVDFVSGAAQTISSYDAFIVDSAGNEQTTLMRAYFPAIANFADWDHLDVLLGPGERLRARGFFNAGAAVNTGNLDAVMMLLPKGNLQLR